MATSIQFSISAEQALANLEGKRDLFVAALTEKLNALDVALQAKIQGKLQGDVLQMRTGKLLRSVEMIPATLEGDVISGNVQAGGGVAFYGIFQEQGTQGPYEIVPTNKKALAFLIGGKTVFAKRVMHPGLTARPFAKPSLDEMEPEIIAGLEAAAAEVAQL